MNFPEFIPKLFMKPHITNLKHQQFCKLMEKAIQEIEKMPDEQKMQVREKAAELINDKDALEGIYADYQFKLKELSHILDQYDRKQHVSRINLRKMQLWLRFSFLKSVKTSF